MKQQSQSKIEDIYGDVRTIYKATHRLQHDIVASGVLPEGCDDILFLKVITDYLYFLQLECVARLYYQTMLPDLNEEAPPLGGADGGLRLWVINHLKP